MPVSFEAFATTGPLAALSMLRLEKAGPDQGSIPSGRHEAVLGYRVE